MNRWLVRIAVYLILGAITTVAVAWGIAYFLAWDMPRPDEASVALHVDERPTHHILVSRWARFGSTTVWVVKGRGKSGNSPHSDLLQVVPQWCRDDVDRRRDEAIGSPERVWSFFEGRGWPMVAVSCEQQGAFARAAGVQQLGILNGIETKRPTVPVTAGYSVPPTRILPLAPVWPGFVIDSLFYAAIWFGVFFGFASAKRFIRVRRGRCPRCGYDLRGQMDAGCPECGWERDDVSGRVSSSRRDDGM